MSMWIVSQGFALPVDQDTVLVETSSEHLPKDYADNTMCSVIPLLENLQYEEQVEVRLTRELLETMLERLDEIADDSSTLMATEFSVCGVRVVPVEE